MAGQQNLAGGAGSSRIEIQATSIEEGDLTGIYPEPLTLYNPLDVTKELIRLERSVEGFNGIVNTLNYLPRGRTSSTGWFLTTRKDIDDNLPLLSEGKLQGVSIKFEEVAEQLRVEGKQTRYKHEHDFTVENLIAIHAYAVTGIPEPPVKVGQPNIKSILTSQATNWENQLYVVQVVDWRYFNHLSSHAQETTNIVDESGEVWAIRGMESDESLNTRTRLWDETSTTDVYGYTPSTTWEDALNSLWSTLPDKGTLGLGNANFPTENPWNRKYWGVSSWDAFNDLIGSINHVLVRDLAGNYELQDLATHTDTTTTDERSDKESELISITNDVTGPSLPEKIRVVFPKLDYQFQTSTHADEVTPLDYWHNRPVWYLDIETTTIMYLGGGEGEEVNTISGTIHIIHSGMYAQWNQRSHTDGDAFPNGQDPAPDNFAALETLATELAIQYVFSRVDKDVNSPHILEELYRGFIDFTPTKSLSSIVWAELGAGPITRIKNLSPSREGEMVRQPSMSRSGGGGSGAPSARYEVSASSSQRVANEFPGSPDHARLGEPSLRWAVVRIEDDLPPSDHEEATVYYGTISGSNLVLGDCSKTITVHNISSTITIAINTMCLAYWHEQSRRWLVSPWESSGTHKAREVCESDYPNRWAKAYPTEPEVSLVDCISDVKLLSANKETYLDVKVNTVEESDEEDCGFGIPVETDVLLSLRGSPFQTFDEYGEPIGTPGAILWSNAEGHIRWTRHPTIGKYVEIGDGEDETYAPFLRFAYGASYAPSQNWTLMARPIDTNLLSTTTGGIPIGETTGINHTVIVPNSLTDWSPGRHLTIKATASAGASTSNCVKLRWTAPGIFGIFEVFGRDALGDEQYYTFDFDDGVLVGIYKATPGDTIVDPRTDNHHNGCDYPVVKNIHPCSGEDEEPS